MDDLYDNLDNYNEETTIAELREENKELKLKLEEYAFTLDKLQNEFDTLASEHKNLEQNYSSLLKTAKAEIERKSQIITKLNIEKDNMVLGAIQNQNTNYIKSRTDPNKYQKSESDDGRRCNNSPSEVSKSYSNNQTRLLDLVNSNLGKQKSSRNTEVKENIMLKDDARKSRAGRISNRRKSMPIFSATLSDEEEIISTDSANELTSRRCTERKHTDQLMREHENALDERIFGQYAYPKEGQPLQWNRSSYHYSREEKYESNHRHRRSYNSGNRKVSPEGQRVSPGRRKSSLDRKRLSPERRRVSPERRRLIPDHRIVSSEKRRISPDRSRVSPLRRRVSPERRISSDRSRVSPLRRRVSPERSRVSPLRRRVSPERIRREPREHNEVFPEYSEHNKHRKLCDRSYYQDLGRPKSRDKYSMKHKLTDLEDSNKKRMKTDHQYEEDRRRNDREKGVSESEPQSLNLDYLNSMTCESPEQTFLDGLAQAPREIKLTATMKLDDPRMSSKKYVVMPHKGKPELISVQNSNIDIKIIDTHGWDMIKRMKLPEALLRKPASIASPLTLFQKSATATAAINTVTALNVPESINSKNKDTLELKLHKQLTDTEPLLKQIADKPEPVLDKQLDDKSEYIANRKLKAAIVPELNEQSIDKLEPVLNNKLEPLPSVSTQKILSSNDLTDRINMDIDIVLSNTSVASEETRDFDDENKNKPTTAEKIIQGKVKQPGSEKIDVNYKIPKKNTTKSTKPSKHRDLHMLDKQSDLHILDKQSDSLIPITKITKSPVDKKQVNEIHNIRDKAHSKKASGRVTKTGIKLDASPVGNGMNIAICSNDIQLDIKNPITTKDIEDDLELSDEAADYTDAQLTKPDVFLNKKTDSEHNYNCHNLKIKKSQLSDQPKVEFGAINKDDNDFDDEKNYRKTKTKDSRKTKTKKKSLKLKEITEPIQNKDSLISINKLPENNCTHPSVDKQVRQNENVLEICPDITSVYEENKTKEIFEQQNTPTNDKGPKKKQNKSKEPPKSPANVDQLNKQTEPKAKKIENKSKFSELFGDSSSLVCPEDLGLVPTVVPSNNLAYFEDAQDAMDLETLQAAITITSLKRTDDKKQVEKSQTNFDSCVAKNNPITNEINFTSLPVLTMESFPVQNDYQNLQPVILSNEYNVMNSIIISSGTQPQCQEGITSSTETNLYEMQCVKPMVIRDLTLQALATSTPQKVWNQNILPEPDPTRNTKRESNGSQESVNTTSTIIDHSVSTDISKTKHDDEQPDLKLFVSRRRKVKRK